MHLGGEVGKLVSAPILHPRGFLRMHMQEFCVCARHDSGGGEARMDKASGCYIYIYIRASEFLRRGIRLETLCSWARLGSLSSPTHNDRPREQKSPTLISSQFICSLHLPWDGKKILIAI